MNGSFEGKKDTDKQFPVRLVDATDFATPETGKAFGDITSKYGYEAATSESTHTVTTAEWKEQGDGNYWLKIGASEFTSEGKYTVKVECGGCADFNFVVEVRDKTVAELIDDLVAVKTATDKLNFTGNNVDSNVAAWSGGGVPSVSTHAAADVWTNSSRTLTAGTKDSEIDAIKAVTDKLDDTVEDDGGTYRFTQNALEQAPGGGSAPTAEEVADAVWDEQQSGHTTEGTFGEYLDSQISGVSATGAGALDVTITCKDDQGDHLDGVAVWITTDSAGSNVVAGTKYTTASGEVTFKLDAGTYWVHRQLSGYEFSPNPKQETVS